MQIVFGNIIFVVEDGKIVLRQFGRLCNDGDNGFVEVQVCGENKDTTLGVKMAKSSEGRRLRYVSHKQELDYLEIIQRSDLVETKTRFTAYGDTNTIRIYTEVKNIADFVIVLEETSAFVLTGFGKRGIDSASDLYFTRFTQSHHAECQPREVSFEQLGLFRGNTESQKRIFGANIGSWSTKEELPQGIIEERDSGNFTMFQIESNASWYYEIADIDERYYLYLGGANLPFGGWSKLLQPGESYRSVSVAVSFGNSLNEVVGEMTKYRRHIAGRNMADIRLPAIFNEYMHLSWDSPTAKNTRKIAPVVAKTGVEYYVIDCGWHNEEAGDKVYPYVGQWKESRARFPEGVRKTTDFIRSLGMKAGFWIEPEIVGIKCQEMLDYYDDDCFLQRNGRKIAVQGRYFLDFRNEKVRLYMSETIRRMVEEYGAEYIKFDYNQDCGVGSDYLAFCVGEGLEQCSKAYLAWVDDIRKRFPDVLFESCSSGGMRMDYKTLSYFSIVSTSDQTDYLKYPYIAGNILSGVLPEQAAVWSYPVGIGEVGLLLPTKYDKTWVAENISDERIVMNMINSFLGRMHLASHLDLLNERQLTLVAEGVAYYNSLSEAKKQSLPRFPNGFTKFGETLIASGMETDEKLYLAIWNLGEDEEVKIPLDGEFERVELAYPKEKNTEYAMIDGVLSVRLLGKTARFFEIAKMRSCF